MKVKIWGARGSTPAPIRPEAIKEKIISALLGIANIESGELREDLISTILDNPEHAVDRSTPGIYEKVYEKIQLKRRQAVENYLNTLSPLSVGTAGGNTPCIEIRSGNDLFIIDAGSGIRELGLELMQGPCGKGEGVIYLFFSHPHWDHIQGFPFFRPAFVPGNKIYIYSVHDIEAALRRQQDSISFPVSLDYMQAAFIFEPLKPGQVLEFGDLRVRNIRNEHPGDAYGFRFEKGNKVFVYASDAAYPDGLDLHPHLGFFDKADVLVFDAQFTQRESDEKEDWGHSSSFMGVEMAQQAGVKNLALFHYDPTYTDRELEDILERTLKFQQNQYPTQPPVKVMIAQEGQTFDLTPEQTTQIQQVPGSKAAILRPTGIFDERIAAELKEQLAAIIRVEWPPQLIIDMSNVELLQVAGLRALVKLRKDYQEHGGSMALVGPSINVQQLIELAGYREFFAIYPSVREALKALEARETLNLPGQVLKERYQIEEKIGEGQLGTVFKAIDMQQNMPVAIKILSPSFSEGAIEQFLRQARQIIDLLHPNIVDVYDCDEDRGIAFMAEEFIDSRTLRDLINETPNQPLPFDVALSIAESITRALEYAHANGVIHGDLKPKNVLLASEVKISDFGLGRLESGKSLINIDVPLTLVTAQYLAPEQVLGHPIDARTDLYALGVILYELFTGRPPFEGSDQQVLEYHRTSSPTPPRRLNPNLSRSLEHLILKLLDKDPNKRYATARQVRHILNSMSTPISGKIQRRAFTIEQWPTLVGREDELSRLTGLWAETRRQQGQVVFINGETGIGKTRLAQELTYCLDDAIVLIGNCQRVEGQVAYQPFIMALKTYFNNTPENGQDEVTKVWRAINRLAPEIEAIVPNLAPPEAATRPVAGFLETLAQATAKSPWLLILDDLQWADPGSLRLLEYLADHGATMGLMIVGIYNNNKNHDGLKENPFLADTLARLKHQTNCTEITLERLAQGEVKELLESLWSQLVPVDLAAAIYHRTEGNPLYVEEIAKALVDEGIVTWRDNKWHFGSVVEAGLARQLNEAIGRRINRLSRETQTFLSQAAILEPATKFSDLHEMSDLSEWDALESLDIALERQLLQEAPGEKEVRFSHAKIQEVLYQGLSSLKRRLMHREAGEALERKYPAEPKEIPHLLAHHFFQAGELEKGLIYSIQAARLAGAAYAQHSALYWYTQALAAIDQLGIDDVTRPQRFELLLAREQIHHRLGNRAAQLADLTTLQRLSQSLNDPNKQAQVHNRQAAYACAIGQFGEAATEAQAGLIAAGQAGNPALESESLAQLAYLEMRQGQYNAAQDYLQSAQKLLKKINNPAAEIKNLLMLAALFNIQNQYANSQAYSQQAHSLSISAGDRFGQARALSNLGDTYLHKKDFAAAQNHLQQALLLNQFIGYRHGEAMCLNRLAAIYNLQGQYNTALQYLEQAITLRREIEDEPGLAEDLLLQGSIFLAAQDYVTGREHVGQALEIFQHSKSKIQEADAWLEIAIALEGLGEIEKAHHAYEQAQLIQESAGNLSGALDAEIGVARCLLAQRKIDDACQRVEKILEEPGLNEAGALRYPVRFYLSAYHVLEAAGKSQPALKALDKGHILLQMWADNIEDSALQTSFLENVPENKALLTQLEQRELEQPAN